MGGKNEVMTKTNPSGGRRGGLLRLLMYGVAIAAVVKELRLPQKDRTWHGQVGFVPYDFRRPTAERFRAAFWAPGSSRLVGPAAFGVGWSVNLARASALLKERVGS